MERQAKARGRKLTPLEKKGILERSRRGELPLDIAKALNVDTLRVSGYVRAMKNRGELPPSAGEIRPPAPLPMGPWRNVPQPPTLLPEALIRDNARLNCQLEVLQAEVEQKDMCIQVLLNQLATRKRK